jgi:molybdopterin/thiamine biosynthesis adenylyltransferase
MLDFSRIEHLLSPASLANKRVLQIGLGSGGAPVYEQLTMNGVRNWTIYDHDTLQGVNLVKHPARRVDLNRLKVDIAKEWIVDRNPEANIEVRSQDVFEAPSLASDFEQCDLALCCADTRAVRLFLNTMAVQHRKPCVTASVFRQGFGGEVYAYIPDYSACFECMDNAAVQLGMNVNDSIKPTAQEEENIYGMNLRDFQASGLSLDILAISIIQARMALDILIHGEPGYTKGANWIIHYNRSLPGDTRSGRLKTAPPLRLKPQKECSCATKQVLNIV